MHDETSLYRGRSEAVVPSPTLRDVLAVLFRQRRLATACFGTVLVLTALYWLVTPAYQAQMKIVLRRERMDPVVSPEPNGAVQMVRGEVTEEDLNSEAELLRDESLLRKVVAANRLQKNGVLGWLGLETNDEEHRIARGVKTLARRLRVDPIRKSNLITVEYAESDPTKAANVLNSLASIYVEKHAQVHRPMGQFPFFEQETTQSRARLGAAEDRLSAFMQNEGVVSAALERDDALQHASELEAGYRQVRVERAETERRIQALRAAMASFPPRSTSILKTSDNPQLLQSLKARLLELQLKRTELLKLFEPSYRLVREVDEQIRQAKAAIVAEAATPLREETTEKDPNYEWAKAELEKAQVDERGLQAREARTQWELSQSWDRAQRLGESAIRQQDLLRDMKTAEDAYLLYARKSEEARIGDALDERGILNVAVIEPPRVPALPRHPGWMVALAGLNAATTLSVGTSFAADALDPAMRTPEEVATCLNVRVLASLPREAA